MVFGKIQRIHAQHVGTIVVEGPVYAYRQSLGARPANTGDVLGKRRGELATGVHHQRVAARVDPSPVIPVLAVCLCNPAGFPASTRHGGPLDLFDGLFDSRGGGGGGGGRRGAPGGGGGRGPEEGS